LIEDGIMDVLPLMNPEGRLAETLQLLAIFLRCRHESKSAHEMPGIIPSMYWSWELNKSQNAEFHQ
jgi:hypothetical protein